MVFTGFDREAFRFYERLAADNTRAFWHANKADYQRLVREPMDRLLADLAEFGPFHVFRPHRDVRFAKDKTPYKNHIGAYGESEGGAGHYVQLSGSGMFAGSGYYDMASDQLERLRRAIDRDATGSELVMLTDALRRGGHTITSMSSLATAPRGYPRDHPRIELLRLKGLIAAQEWSVQPWMSTRSVATRIRASWNAAADLAEWLDAHVGPSTLAPDDGEIARFGPL